MRSTDARTRTGRSVRRVVAFAAGFALIWAAIAYLALPYVWRRVEGGAAPRAGMSAALSVTAQGIHGDPINLALLADKATLFCAMRKAGWRPADPVTYKSSVRIVESVLFHRAYAHAPVSALFWRGKRQDYAFEKPVGGSAKLRHHVRFWATARGGAPAFVGSVTFDRAVGVSHYTGQITHHIGLDVDAERDGLAADLAKADAGSEMAALIGIGPTKTGRNGGGDPYRTDGAVALLRLACPRPGSAMAAPAPAKIGAPRETLSAWLGG